MKTPTRLVITRSTELGEAWRTRLAAAGVDALLLPLIRYELLPLPAAETLARADWLLFTSPQAVRAFYRPGAALPDGPAIASLHAGTARALAALGHPADLALRAADGAAMAADFGAQIAAPATLLLPGAERRLPEPADSLRGMGFDVTEAAIYRTLAVAPQALPADPFRAGDCVLFASPSAVDAFRVAWPHRQVDCAALGETTAAACRDAGLAPRVAASPDLDSLCAAAGLPLTAAEGAHDV